MSTCILSAEAREDLISIWEYLVEGSSLPTADRVLDDLSSAMDRLADFPGLGHLREDLANKPIRFFRVHSYLILYRQRESQLQIARILHSARDIKSILGEE